MMSFTRVILLANILLFFCRIKWAFPEQLVKYQNRLSIFSKYLRKSGQWHHDENPSSTCRSFLFPRTHIARVPEKTNHSTIIVKQKKHLYCWHECSKLNPSNVKFFFRNISASKTLFIRVSPNHIRENIVITQHGSGYKMWNETLESIFCSPNGIFIHHSQLEKQNFQIRMITAPTQRGWCWPAQEDLISTLS